MPLRRGGEQALEHRCGQRGGRPPLAAGVEPAGYVIGVDQGLNDTHRGEAVWVGDAVGVVGTVFGVGAQDCATQQLAVDREGI